MENTTAAPTTPALVTDATAPARSAQLSHTRRQLLDRTREIFFAQIPAVEQHDVVPKMTAVLSASLEELKVAEEELAEQHDELAVARDRLEAHARHYEQLFQYAPTCLLVTDLYGGVREANRAACTLLGRTQDMLYRKPLTALIPREARRRFREELSRITITQGVTNWHFILDRPHDRPVEVSAAVHVAPGGATGAGVLYWVLRGMREVD